MSVDPTATERSLSFGARVPKGRIQPVLIGILALAIISEARTFEPGY